MDSVQKPSYVFGGLSQTSGTQAATFYAPMRKCMKYADCRFQFVIPATGTPNGVWTLEGSEDPRVFRDLEPVAGGAPVYGTANETAKWVPLALSGDITVTKTAGSTGLTINAGDLTTTGATEMECVVKVKTPFSFLRWKWTRASGTITSGLLLFGGRGA